MAQTSTRSWASRVLSPRVLRRAYPIFERLGVHVTPVHFYQPVPDTRTLGGELWTRRSELVGIDLRVDDQLALLDEIHAARGDAPPLPRGATGAAHRFHLDNGTFGDVDAEVLRHLIHHHRPRRIVEIGSGYSTMLAAQALLEVADQHGEPPGELVAIEPYPSEVLRHGFPGLSRLVPSSDLAAIAPPLVCELQAGDILFIDSTHVLHLASDVRTELLRLVPLVAPGVLVHVHDIFFPLEYPRRWVMENRWFWTEQYLLQAFLIGNQSFDVVWASHLMHVDHPERLAAAIDSYDPERSAPGSFWFRRVR